jgi:phenylacetate-CoA ligase
LLEKIEGRIQEQIIINDGSKVAMTSLIFSQHFKAFGKMKSIQLEQNEIGKVIVRIVQKEAFTDSDIHEIINKMEKACNDKLKVELKFVESIDRTNRGKQKILIQNIEF